MKILNIGKGTMGAYTLLMELKTSYSLSKRPFGNPNVLFNNQDTYKK